MKFQIKTEGQILQLTPVYEKLHFVIQFGFLQLDWFLHNGSLGVCYISNLINSCYRKHFVDSCHVEVIISFHRNSLHLKLSLLCPQWNGCLWNEWGVKSLQIWEILSSLMYFKKTFNSLKLWIFPQWIEKESWKTITWWNLSDFYRPKKNLCHVSNVCRYNLFLNICFTQISKFDLLCVFITGSRKIVNQEIKFWLNIYLNLQLWCHWR